VFQPEPLRCPVRAAAIFRAGGNRLSIMSGIGVPNTAD
jgi:hypothetical protein